MEEITINWSVFLLTEKKNLKMAADKGDYKVFANLIEEMTPEKEIELQKLVDLHRVGAEDYQSEVRSEMKTAFHEKPVQELTPEEEKEWQEKLDREKEALKKKNAKKSKERAEALKKAEKDITSETVEEKDKK